MFSETMFDPVCGPMLIMVAALILLSFISGYKYGYRKRGYFEHGREVDLVRVIKRRLFGGWLID